jgi:hypothetical protein
VDGTHHGGPFGITGYCLVIPYANEATNTIIFPHGGAVKAGIYDTYLMVPPAVVYNESVAVHRTSLATTDLTLNAYKSSCYIDPGFHDGNFHTLHGAILEYATPDGKIGVMVYGLPIGNPNCIINQSGGGASSNQRISTSITFAIHPDTTAPSS